MYTGKNKLTRIEIPLDEVEQGIFGETDYRLDLKFYSPKLKSSYGKLLESNYPLMLVKDIADPIEERVKIDEDKEYLYLEIGHIDGSLGEVMDYSCIPGGNFVVKKSLTN